MEALILLNKKTGKHEWVIDTGSIGQIVIMEDGL